MRHRSLLCVPYAAIVGIVILGRFAEGLMAAEDVGSPIPLSFAAAEVGAAQASGDGRFLVFVGAITNSVREEERRVPQYTLNVFVRDLNTGHTTLVSISHDGGASGDGRSNYPTISSDGRFVMFESTASNLVTNDQNAVSDIFVRDLPGNRTTLVSVSTNVLEAGNGASTGAVITPDGRYVAFESLASNLVVGDTNQIRDIFVRDLEVGRTVLASTGARPRAPSRFSGSGETLLGSEAPALSDDGQVVAFVSRALGLVPGPETQGRQVYVRNLALNTTMRVNEPNPGPARSEAFAPAISGDGRFLAFKTSGLLPRICGLFREREEESFS